MDDWHSDLQRDLFAQVAGLDLNSDCLALCYLSVCCSQVDCSQVLESRVDYLRDFELPACYYSVDYMPDSDSPACCCMLADYSLADYLKEFVFPGVCYYLPDEHYYLFDYNSDTAWKDADY